MTQPDPLGIELRAPAPHKSKIEHVQQILGHRGARSFNGQTVSTVVHRVIKMKNWDQVNGLRISLKLLLSLTMMQVNSVIRTFQMTEQWAHLGLAVVLFF